MREIGKIGEWVGLERGKGRREGERDGEREVERGRKRERSERQRKRETVSYVDVAHCVVLKRRISSILNIDVQFDKKYSLVTVLSNKRLNKL